MTQWKKAQLFRRLLPTMEAIWQLRRLLKQREKEEEEAA
jgi:hypothetical protein